MKRIFVITLLASFLSLCCLGSAEVNAVPPPPGPSIPIKEPPLWLIPNIVGSWHGKGKFFSTLQQETSPYLIDVTINIAAQSEGLFNGSMLLSYDTPIIPWSTITSLSFNIGGNISSNGDLVINGVAVIPNFMQIPLIGPITAFFQEEATASLIPGKLRRLTGNYRFTAQFDPALKDILGSAGFAFPGTFDVQEQLVDR